MIVGPDDLFYIQDGVHRAVAARTLGLTVFPARLIRERVADETIYVELGRLYSPRSAIGRWDRKRDFYELVEFLRTPRGRMTIRAIDIQPLGIEGQTGSVPLADVRVEES